MCSPPVRATEGRLSARLGRYTGAREDPRRLRNLFSCPRLCSHLYFRINVSTPPGIWNMVCPNFTRITVQGSTTGSYMSDPSLITLHSSPTEHIGFGVQAHRKYTGRFTLSKTLSLTQTTTHRRRLPPTKSDQALARCHDGRRAYSHKATYGRRASGRMRERPSIT